MNQGTGKGQPYEGPASAMKDSDWLSVEDMQASGRAHVDLTIERVLLHKNVQFEGGRREARKYSLAFRGAEKQLLLNATNRKRLVGMYGGNTKDWLGKKIRLHLEEDKLPTGGRGPCTRIVKMKLEAPQQTRPQQQEPVQQQQYEPQPEPGATEQDYEDGLIGGDDNWTEGLE